MRKAIILIYAALILSLGPATVADNQKLQVVTTIFPLYDWSWQIGGEKVEVKQLLPPGVEAHTFSPSPEDVLRLNKADAFVYTGEYMEPWAEDLLAGVANKNLKVIDASQGIELVAEEDHEEMETAGHHEQRQGQPHEPKHEHGHLDPHIWLDPVLAQTMVRTIATGLAARDPDNKDYYRANAEAYNAQLEKLNQEIAAGLAPCKQDTIIYGGHFAFGYFARRYGLEHVSPYPGFAPDSEPSPRAIAHLIKQMRERGSKAIYYEELLEPKVAKVIADETRAELLLLHGVHNLTKEERLQGMSYLSIMRDNLQRLKIGLQCE
jgi:zinc transport system substrate-binding protein